MDDVHEPPRNVDATPSVLDESVVDGLYELPAAAFVAARNEVARALAAAGRRDAAAVVKGLRRPTMAAWAVNQVVRSRPATWARVETAGATVQRAQRRALAGIADNGLRDAAVERRRAVEAATDAAAEVLHQAGANPTSHLDDVATTFESASASADVAAVVGSGRLASPITASGGFAGALGLAAVPSVAPEAQAATEGDDDPDGVDAAQAARRREAIRALEDARRRVEDRAAVARVASDEVEVARDRAAVARRDAERARAAATAADARADELEAAAATSGWAAEAARREAATAARDVAAAQAALDDLA